MRIFLPSHLFFFRNALLYLSLVLSLFYGCFLFDGIDHVLKKILLITLCLALLLNPPVLETWKKYIQFITPWLPWFVCCICIPIVYHQSSGLSHHLSLFVIISLMYLVLSKVELHEKLVLFSVTVTVLILSLSSVTEICINGLSTNLLGINKNILIGGCTLLTAISLMAVTFSKYNYSRYFCIYLITVSIIALIAIIFSEVRTAILGLGSLLLIFCTLLRKKISRYHVIGAFLLLAIVLISFLISGRIQEGIHDLQLWQNGNSNSSWGIRLELWPLALSSFHEHILFGWGYNTIDTLLAHGYNFPIKTFNAEHFHSDFFSYLSACGLIGIFGWFSTVVLLYKYAHTDPLRLALLGAMFCMSFTDCYWSFFHYVLYVFAIIWTLFSVSKKNN